MTFGECHCPSGTVLFLSHTEVCASVFESAWHPTDTGCFPDNDDLALI